MNSITVVTQKGQVTIPVWLRRKMGVEPYDTVMLEAGNGYVKISPVEDILDIAGRFKAPRGKSALKAREEMERSYGRT